MKEIVYLIFLLPICSFAQKNTGIHFEKGISWIQLREKARQENKYIFMDVYATWCLPCKQMDKGVYSNDTVGNFINDSFISIKVQFDTSKSDDENTKSWYADANKLILENRIRAFPAFLFYSPDGILVHEEIGDKSEFEFIKTASYALDSNRQFFTLIKKYEQGVLNYHMMMDLAQRAKDLQKKDLADSIASNYIHNYLNRMTEGNFLNLENIGFLYKFYEIVTSKDKIFNFFYSEPSKIDSILKAKGFSQYVVDYIITNEEIRPALETANFADIDPDWNVINESISKKYNKIYAKRNIDNAKPNYYQERKDWVNYTKSLVKIVENNDIDNLSHDQQGAYYLNGIVWEILQYSNKESELKKALTWSDYYIDFAPSEMKPGLMDTKANILYKLGKRAEALNLEKKAFLLGQKDRDIQDAFLKMKKNEPNWIVPLKKKTKKNLDKTKYAL